MTALKVSFEFFPPHDAAAETKLWQCIERLAPLHPAFVSVTYGAGGSTRARTARIVRRIHADTPVSPAAHLTCIGAEPGGIDEPARQIGRGAGRDKERRDV